MSSSKSTLCDTLDVDAPRNDESELGHDKVPKHLPELRNTAPEPIQVQFIGGDLRVNDNAIDGL
jgi:hypothetical protein